MKILWFQRKRDAQGPKDESPSRAAVREQIASEACASLIRDALERFSEFEPDQAQILVHEVLEQFFFEVMDLGASESYHHAGPWGLARHSLEVAVGAIRVARSRHFVGHAAPNPEEEAHRLPRMRYACFLLALYHDAGKALQARVLGPDRALHNPFVEPLGAFYDRHGREQCSLQWREGRDLEDHVRLTPYLVGRILPRAAAAYIGPGTLAEILEKKTTGAVEVHEIIVEADKNSVCQDRRQAEAKANPAGPAYASGSLVAYLAKSFAEGTRQNRLAVNVFGGDVLLGHRFAFFSFPAAVLKLLSLVKEGFGPSDMAARMLAEDEGGARFFLAKLKADEGLFTDPSTGLWKLKATIQQGGSSDVQEGVLIPMAHLGLAPGTSAPFPGSIAFHRTADGSEVVIDDFRAATPNVAPAPKPAAPPPEPSPQPAPPPATPPVPADPKPPATNVPQGGIAPEALVRDLVEGILGGWIPTNMWQAQVYVSPRLTFVITPAVFLRMRERGLYPEFDPQDLRSPYLRALASLGFVRKSMTNRIVYPIFLGPESERPLKVIKFDTLGLFKSQEIRDRVGLWKNWDRIIELPQDWKPGDALLPGEASDD